MLHRYNDQLLYSNPSLEYNNLVPVWFDLGIVFIKPMFASYHILPYLAGKIFVEFTKYFPCVAYMDVEVGCFCLIAEATG